MGSKAEAQVAYLVEEIEKFKARLEAASSQGTQTHLVKRKLAQLEAELVIARRRAAEELSALPAAGAHG
ncbi:hypothetical protein [Paraburkholderia diazotrophica]|uniref:Uncharacterized protein n=1 Tax=Paraburkholderia diazotrophica TaxID=667676 RepID=A0A1H6TKV3_9BURK|nr:hypothetical protein [Paraburkholderia diazotrophica]SEI80678.1 hypothetical protein SAMN05192539_1004171 [Paraburkholderia diazotrophica]